MSPSEMDPLASAIVKQEGLLRSMQLAHGEFHLSVSDDLAQLAVLYNMRGDHERALTLLHKRLVIHEKHGPLERISETLHELGTTYRLQGMPDMALQHLERALSTRESSHGDKSFKAAETLNSLALLCKERSDVDKAEQFQLQSLGALLESVEPVDLESEDVPWEVYKRLKQQCGPSTAANSITLLKGTLRKCAEDALARTDSVLGSGETVDPTERLPAREPERAVSFFGATDNSAKESPRPLSPPHALAATGRSTRSKSDSAMLKLRHDQEAVEELEGHLFSGAQALNDDYDDFSSGEVDAPPTSLSSVTSEPADAVHRPIVDVAALQLRVESIKRRLVSGAIDMDMEIARLAADVVRIPASSELRAIGETMVGLVREMHRMRVRLEGDAKQMPVLEGHLEKKSASIFRGFEKRFFKVDPKAFVLSYHFSRDDYARGFAPRGGFPIVRISSIVVHRQPPRGGGGSSSRNGWFYFDVVVDLSTRHNPNATRTYELRADSADALRYWVDTLQYYKATAQASSGTTLATARPGTS